MHIRMYTHMQRSRNDMIGKVCEEYTTYNRDNENVIGDGGFGKVYKLNDKHAVKEESKVMI